MRSRSPLCSGVGPPRAGGLDGDPAPGENATVVPVSVGVAVPELGTEPGRGRDDVEAKRVDKDWFERRKGRLASDDAGDCARCLGRTVDCSSAPSGGECIGEPCGG
jgi:hypothetical protein